MYQIDTERLRREIKEQFSLSCSIDLTDNPDARFSLTLRSNDFILETICSDARVSVYLPINQFEEALGKTLLAQIFHLREGLEADLKPFSLEVWKSDSKPYSMLPKVEILRQNSQLIVEVFSGPRDLTTQIAAYISTQELIFKCLSWVCSVEPINELEGHRHEYLSSRVERSKRNRDLCIALFGYECQICDSNLSDKYGELADGFIHVHHIESIASSGERWIDPFTDLITVCPNCHSMLHRTSPPLHPSELKSIIKKTSKETL